MWLNRIRNKNDKETSKSYLKATIYGINENFYYHRLSRKDILRREVLTNIMGMDTSFVIVTSHAYNFKISDIISINNVLYSIKSIYTEEVSNTNNHWLIPGLDKTYLNLYEVKV